MSQLDRSATVAQIVVEHGVAARIFQRHRIDFCCHGEVTVSEACRTRNLDPDAVYAELEAALPAGPDAEDARTASTPALIVRIVERHHGYVRRAAPFVGPLAAKVARVHGEHNAKLEPLRETLDALIAALLPHMDREETVLFPALVAKAPDAAVVREELATMHDDHLAVGRLLARLRELSDEFTTPEWGCNSYRVYTAELAALEEDVLRHVHLENHVLLPRFAGDAPRPGADPVATSP